MTEQEAVEINFLKDADSTIIAEINTFKNYLIESSKFFDEKTDAESELKGKDESFKKFLYNSQLLTYYAFLKLG